MKKAFLRILCLLLGLNVFTACYGPSIPEREKMEAELAEAEAATSEGEAPAEGETGAEAQ